MVNYRPTFGIEPINDYEKAKQDVIKAMNSVSKLSPQQRQRLAEELWGAANAAALFSILIR